MVRYVVTSTEADVINAVDEKLGATVTELSGSTHLAPGEVREALRRLTDRGLIQSTEDDNILFLTGDGHRLHQGLAGTSATDVWVVAEDNVPVDLNDDSLDAAIEEAISAENVGVAIEEPTSEAR